MSLASAILSWINCWWALLLTLLVLFVNLFPICGPLFSVRWRVKQWRVKLPKISIVGPLLPSKTVPPPGVWLLTLRRLSWPNLFPVCFLSVFLFCIWSLFFVFVFLVFVFHRWCFVFCIHYPTLLPCPGKNLWSVDIFFCISFVFCVFFLCFECCVFCVQYLLLSILYLYFLSPQLVLLTKLVSYLLFKLLCIICQFVLIIALAISRVRDRHNIW